MAIGGCVVRGGKGGDGGGDCGVRVGTAVGTSVGTGVTAVGVIGTGVEVSVGIATGFSGGSFFWPRYHPAPPTITKAPIMIAIRINLRPGGGTGGFAIDGLSG